MCSCSLMCVCVDDRRLPKELCVGYFVDVVGNETKCAAVGDAAYATLLNAWGVLLSGVFNQIFGVGGGAPPLCDLSEAAENLIQPAIFFKIGLHSVGSLRTTTG
mmetsp:Transcript_26132/g.40200  ORF Transcript_26132/g.40200 Transcript_26132/m.40200 type:complete len:104 (+) Transcript_26132:1235-1546(+)